MIRDQPGWADLIVDQALRHGPTTAAGIEEDRQRAATRVADGLSASDRMLTLLPDVPAHTQLVELAQVARDDRDAALRAARSAGIGPAQLAEDSGLSIEQIHEILTAGTATPATPPRDHPAGRA